MVRISEFILSLVLNAAWQIVAIATVAAIGALLLKNSPARFRHTLWLFALVAALIVPLFTASGLMPQSLPGFRSAVTRPETSSVPITVAATAGTAVIEERSFDLVTRHHQEINTTPDMALFLTLAIAIFIAARGIRLAHFWRRKERLRRSTTLRGLSHEDEIVAERCRRLLSVGEVRVMRSGEVRVPYTLGAISPLIVVPEAFCVGADENRLLSVIGHEMAHVKRRDFLSNLFCELLLLPISFHPLAFFIKRQIDRARELACDELVTKDVLEPRVYARSLLWAADIIHQHSSQEFTLSILGGEILEERIARLMRNRRRLGSGSARALMFVALLLIGSTAVSLSLFSIELQTAAHAHVIDPLELRNFQLTEDPVVSSITQTPRQSEPQLTATSAAERASSACRSGKQGDTHAIPSLIVMLGDDTRIDLIKCWDTGRWSPALETFKHPSPGEQAALALASFGSASFVPLLNQLGSSNTTVRRNAAWAIGELTGMFPGQRANAVPQLISLLRDPDEWVRMAAARALGELRDERGLEQLLGTLADDDWRVRQLVVWALSEMKDARAVDALCAVLLSDARVEVRRGAAEALGEIRSVEALPSLKQALNDAEVSTKAAWAIEEIEG